MLPSKSEQRLTHEPPFSGDNIEAEKHMLAAYPKLAGMYQPGDGNNEFIRLKTVTAMFASFTESAKTVKL